MARRQTLISEIANDARTARLEPTLMKGAATLEPQGVRFKRERERELTHHHQSCREKGLQPPPSVIFKTRSNLSFLNTLFFGGWDSQMIFFRGMSRLHERGWSVFLDLDALL